MFFIFNGDGELTLRDVYKECQKESAEIRKSFKETPLEHVWFPYDDLLRLSNENSEKET